MAISWTCIFGQTMTTAKNRYLQWAKIVQNNNDYCTTSMRYVINGVGFVGKFGRIPCMILLLKILVPYKCRL